MRYEIDWLTPSQFLGTNSPKTKVRFQGPVSTRVCDGDGHGCSQLGHCNYVELIDTIFTDVEGVD
jgi:hypothetical protein